MLHANGHTACMRVACIHDNNLLSVKVIFLTYYYYILYIYIMLTPLPLSLETEHTNRRAITVVSQYLMKFDIFIRFIQCALIQLCPDFEAGPTIG